MYYDMNNTKKSWKGMPVTNLFGDIVNYAGLNSYWFLLDNNTNYFLISSSYNSWCMNFVCTLAASTQYTLSFEYKTASAGTLVIDNDGVDDNTWNATINTTSDWQTYTFTRTEITAGVMTLYFRRNTGGDIEVRNVQIEANSFASGFVKGTRSTTQAIVDLTGNNTLTATNLTYNSNNTFSFNGTNSWLESPTSTVFDSQTITMESWNKPTATSQSGFLFEKGQVNTQYSNFYDISGTFYFRIAGLTPLDLTFAAATYITAGQWNHIVCTYGAGIKTIYVNGVQIIQQTGVTGTLATGNINQYIGKYGSAAINYPFNGQIGQSRVYNRALTASEVTQNFNAHRRGYGI
jgi:hypothetical protein